MERVRGHRRGQSGFTLLELAIVMAIVSVLALIAMPNLAQMMPRFRLNGAVREFTDKVQLTRLMAVSQNKEFRMCLSAKDASAGSGAVTSNTGKYQIQVGDKSSGSSTWTTIPTGNIDEEGTVTLTYSSTNRSYSGISISAWTPMTGPTTGNTNCIVMSPRGWVSNPSGDFVGGYLQVAFRNKAANPRDDSRTVLITRGGMSRIRVGTISTN
jgi:prepilin-type N-terminal cleavage/methylation domain-containing protein